MANKRKPNSPDQTTILIQLPQSLKNDVYSIACKRGEPAAVVIREALREFIGSGVA